MITSQSCAKMFWRGLRFAKALVLGVAILGTCVFACLLPFAVVLASEYHQFSPIQKYWFLTYWRSEFSGNDQRVYRLLVVEDSNNDRWLANAENVSPGVTRTTEGKEIPFVLAAKEQQEGKHLVLLPPAPQPNDYLWESLRDQVYSGQSIRDMGAWMITLGFGLKLGLLTLLYWFFSSVFLIVRRRVRYNKRARTEQTVRV